MINLILTIVLVAMIIFVFLMLRQVYLFKTALDQVLLLEMKNYEANSLVQKNINKELKNQIDTVIKLGKDINNIKTGLKTTVEDLKLKIKSIPDTKDK